MRKNEALDAENRYKSDVEKTAEYVEFFDILETLTNVGSDEVFTPRKVVDMMLDALPKEVWSNPDYRWLNPASKTGIFEREIAIRLDVGLKDIIPDTETRRKHILQDMIFSIGQTKFTANVARRTLYYCCQANRPCDGLMEDGHYVNGYAIGNGTWFDDAEGNVKTPISNHLIKKDRCIYCGIPSNSEYLDRNQRENYSYDFIHCNPGDEIQTYLANRFFNGDKNVKFDVVVGNPPYHLSTNAKGTQAMPIYQLFAMQAFSLNPRYVSMIMPSKWFAGGMSNLSDFREYMMTCHKIRYIKDFTNAKDCFPTNNLGGGVNYFLWDREYNGLCEFINISNNEEVTDLRDLAEFPVVMRFNYAVSILRKVRSKNEPTLDEIASPISPFGIPTTICGENIPSATNNITLYSSNKISYISEKTIVKGKDLLQNYKVIVGILAAGHALEPNKEGKFRLITSSMKVIGPNEACTHSYFTIGCFDNKKCAEGLLSYMKCKFSRFLILLSTTSTHLSRNVLTFLPQQDFSKCYTDEELYSKYDLSSDEVNYIENLMEEMI